MRLHVAEQVQKQLAALAEDLRLVKRRLEAGGRKDVLGRMLLALRDSLPNVSELERDIGRRTELLGDLALSRVEAEEELRALRDSDAYLQQRFPDHDQLDARTQGLIARFIEQRRELLERGTHRQEELNLKLTDTNTRTHELVELTSNFQQFLMGNLLWVRDYSFVSPTLLWSQLSSLLAPANWLPLPQALGQGLVHGQWEMLGLVLMLALLLGRRWLQPQLQALLQRPPSLADEKVSHSGKALLLGLLLVLPWPLLLHVCGRLLLQSPDPSTFIAALGRGLVHLSMALLVILLVRKLVAERAVKAGVQEVVFDRGAFIYHGRIKALAEAARDAVAHHGLEKLLLAREIEEQRALGNPGPGGDLFDAGGGVALFPEEVERGFQQLARTLVLAAAALSGRLGGGG